MNGLEPIRLAVALSHCLPDCGVELSTEDGDAVIVGFGADDDLSPCQACAAVATAMRTSESCLGPILGLSSASCPRVRLLDADIESSHIGLGVYRHSDEESWGYVFATVIPPTLVRSIIKEKSAEQLKTFTAACHELIHVGEWQLSHDAGIEVTICSCRYPTTSAGLLALAEQLALDVAAGCLSEELCAEPAAAGY